MANAIFVAQDFSLFTPSATSTNASFPVTNLQSYILTDVWKSNSVNIQSLIFDFGSAVPVDTAIIVGHNIPALTVVSPGTIELQGAADSGFSSGVVTVNNALSLLSADPLYLTFASQSKRYWRILFNQNGMATQPQIAKVFLCTRLDFGFPYDLPFKGPNKVYKTTEKEMISGLIRTSQVMKGRRIFEISFIGNKGGITDSVRSQFRTFIDTVRGKLRPYYFVDLDGTLYYVHLNIDEDQVEGYRYNVNSINKIPMKTQTVS